MSREPYASEQPRALTYHLRTNRHWLAKGSRNGAIILANVFNDAACPWLYRTDLEHHQCLRIRKYCRTLRARLFPEITDRESGSWSVA